MVKEYEKDLISSGSVQWPKSQQPCCVSVWLYGSLKHQTVQMLTSRFIILVYHCSYHFPISTKPNETDLISLDSLWSVFKLKFLLPLLLKQRMWNFKILIHPNYVLICVQFCWKFSGNYNFYGHFHDVRMWGSRFRQHQQWALWTRHPTCVMQAPVKATITATTLTVSWNCRNLEMLS